METSTFENYPWWMVATCNAVGWTIYAIGLCLMARQGLAWAVPYAAFCLWVEWRVLSSSCRSCYYYGKRCGFGKGRVCSWFYPKAEDQRLEAIRVTWRDVAPDFLVSLIPVGVGIAALVQDFTWSVLLLVVALVLLGSAGTGLVRGQLACRYCRQRELGCPAQRLFSRAGQAGQGRPGP